MVLALYHRNYGFLSKTDNYTNSLSEAVTFITDASLNHFVDTVVKSNIGMARHLCYLKKISISSEGDKIISDHGWSYDAIFTYWVKLSLQIGYIRNRNNPIVNNHYLLDNDNVCVMNYDAYISLIKHLGNQNKEITYNYINFVMKEIVQYLIGESPLIVDENLFIMANNDDMFKLVLACEHITKCNFNGARHFVKEALEE